MISNDGEAQELINNVCSNRKWSDVDVLVLHRYISDNLDVKIDLMDSLDFLEPSQIVSELVLYMASANKFTLQCLSSTYFNNLCSHGNVSEALQLIKKASTFIAEPCLTCKVCQLFLNDRATDFSFEDFQYVARYFKEIPDSYYQQIKYLANIFAKNADDKTIRIVISGQPDLLEIEFYREYYAKNMLDDESIFRSILERISAKEQFLDHFTPIMLESPSRYEKHISLLTNLTIIFDTSIFSDLMEYIVTEQTKLNMINLKNILSNYPEDILIEDIKAGHFDSISDVEYLRLFIEIILKLCSKESFDYIFGEGQFNNFIEYINSGFIDNLSEDERIMIDMIKDLNI